MNKSSSKKSKVKYVSPIKEYAITFDATINIKQTGLEGCLPYFIKADKNKYDGLTKEEKFDLVKKAIKQALLDKCSWITSVVSLDNVKISQSLINESNSKQES